MKAYLNIFSGRENPSWDFTAREREQFLRLLHSMPRKESDGAPPGILGYNGFTLLPNRRPEEDFDEITVCDGSAIVTKKNTVARYIDHERKLEKWLLSKAEKFIDRDLYEEIKGIVDNG
jgi:hypothetical protein